MPASLLESELLGHVRGALYRRLEELHVVISPEALVFVGVVGYMACWWKSVNISSRWTPGSNVSYI